MLTATSQSLAISGVNVTVDPYITKANAGTTLGLSPLAFAELSPDIFFPPENFDSTSNSNVYFTFDIPVTNFGVDIIGSHFAGNYLVGYDVNGKEIARSEAAYSDANTGYNARVQIQAPSLTPFYAVRIFGTNVSGKVSASGYQNITVVPSTTAGVTGIPLLTTQIPSSSTSSPTLFGPATQSVPPTVTSPTASIAALQVNLSDIVVPSSTLFDHLYVKGTLAVIAGDKFTLTNVSQVIDVDVAIKGIAGVSFVPANFTLKAGTIQGVTMSYDQTQIEQLPEGLNTIMPVISLSSNTILAVPVFAPQVPNPPAPSSSVANTIPTVGYLEQRFAGSPDETPEAAIFAQTPTLTQTVNQINYAGANAIPAGTTVRWQQTLVLSAESYYTFTFTADDGMRLYIDDTLMLNGWKDQAATTYQTVWLGISGNHILRIEYYNDRAAGTAIFSYTQGANYVGSTTSTGTQQVPIINQITSSLSGIDLIPSSVANNTVRFVTSSATSSNIWL